MDHLMPGGAWTGDDREHNDACHERWLPARNRPTDQPGYRDDWFDEQCGGCRFWVALSGELGRDWGVCTRSDELAPLVYGPNCSLGYGRTLGDAGVHIQGCVYEVTRLSGDMPPGEDLDLGGSGEEPGVLGAVSLS
ncbi:hypothetical protein [Streptomyces sp. NPDC051576]|uniref:hypothetical protein n=1 Tax=Streptomyces sp. NPDC051576 TaxID=3155803 RepID=UPI003441B494